MKMPLRPVLQNQNSLPRRQQRTKNPPNNVAVQHLE
jgi:hypothetical protein